MHMGSRRVVRVNLHLAHGIDFEMDGQFSHGYSYGLVYRESPDAKQHSHGFRLPEVTAR